jgi:hypothetical protein
MKKAEQKLISFSKRSTEMEEIQNQMREGWHIISLVSMGKNYVGILEKAANENNAPEADAVYIPARKKIKIL